MTNQERDAGGTGHKADPHLVSWPCPSPGHPAVRFHVDGMDYFHALSVMIDEAKESIMILDWWLTPELFLRRGGDHPEWRLDRLLLRKAQEGVKIYVSVYKEVTQSM